jgi:hypothetical protein
MKMMIFNGQLNRRAVELLRHGLFRVVGTTRGTKESKNILLTPYPVGGSTKDGRTKLMCKPAQQDCASLPPLVGLGLRLFFVLSRSGRNQSLVMQRESAWAGASDFGIDIWRRLLLAIHYCQLLRKKPDHKVAELEPPTGLLHPRDSRDAADSHQPLWAKQGL